MKPPATQRRLTRDELESMRADGDELLTIKEAAEALEVTYALVHRWVREGDVPWALVDRRVMVPLITISHYQRDEDHGYAAYRRGCRCIRCRSAYADYRRAERMRRRAG